MTSTDKPARVANIFDVARLAGVSHQTVSRVLNDIPSVRPATRLRVEQAITQLRYSPSPAARALVTRRTRMIGLIAPSSVDFGSSSIALNFSSAARDARYGVVTVTAVNADATSIRPFVESLLSQRVEAIVLIVSDLAVLDAVRSLDTGVPVIAVASGQRRGHLSTSIDQYRGARAAVRHLIELGHRRIAHLSGPAGAPDAIERVRGWRDELAAAQLLAREPGHGDWSAESGYRFVDSLGDATAVFAANDQMALGLISALVGRGLSVPGHVSIVGFDDLPEAAFYLPSLTTVNQDFAALGALTMQRVLIALEEPDTAAESTPIPTRLMVRESTGAPRVE
ncbi:MAG: LacI family DNA-binding transcriptional regulator [Rhodoglobus sp.]